jgi:Protein of unknown function (DUF2892)
MESFKLLELDMAPNVGTLDRSARIGVGLLLVVLAATNVVGAWGYLGLVLVLTGLLRVCPAYALLGIKTCPAKPR